MNFIENIKEKNQFPIIFIGSGITQRYFKDAPTWEGLLIRLWAYVYEEEDFYTYFHELKQDGKGDFQINLELAKKLEKEIDRAFYRGELEISHLEIKTAHKEKISPFRRLIANIFSNLDQREGMEEEIDAFANMIIKARFVITTNYDCFIETCYYNKGAEIGVNIGSVGLFKRTTSYGELYKIHGSIGQINSLCITASDYEKNEAKLALVNAKILSNLTESPILFLGYSLTDENVRALLETYSENFPFKISEAASRIGIVEWTAGEERILNFMAHDSTINMHYTKINTDNYLEIYKQVAMIDQGYLPSEITKYERAFRKIIEVKGAQEGLDTILTSFEDLSKLTNKQIQSKNLVVAFGDNRYVYRMPNYTDYIKDYFLSTDEMPVEVVLKFLFSQPSSTPIPIKKYLKRVSNLQGLVKEREAFDNRRIRQEGFWERNKNIGISKKDIPIFKCATNPKSIYDLTEAREFSKLNYIVLNMKSFSLYDVASFIKEILETKSDETISKTEYRRLFMAYSLLL